jgi:hypothetical protein
MEIKMNKKETKYEFVGFLIIVGILVLMFTVLKNNTPIGKYETKTKKPSTKKHNRNDDDDFILPPGFGMPF